MNEGRFFDIGYLEVGLDNVFQGVVDGGGEVV